MTEKLLGVVLLRIKKKKKHNAFLRALAIFTDERMLTSCKMSSSFGITQSSSEASLTDVRGKQREGGSEWMKNKLWTSQYKTSAVLSLFPVYLLTSWIFFFVFGRKRRKWTYSTDNHKTSHFYFYFYSTKLIHYGQYFR